MNKLLKGFGGTRCYLCFAFGLSECLNHDGYQSLEKIIMNTSVRAADDDQEKHQLLLMGSRLIRVTSYCAATKLLYQPSRLLVRSILTGWHPLVDLII